jgi:L-rhamnose mutarotase
VSRVCFLLQVRPERLAEYKSRHKVVWPEMRQALRETGWTNYSLFLRDDGLLVGYVETDDFEAARAAMEKLDVNARWQKEMSELFVNPPGVTPDQAMKPLEEVFHLD